MLVFVRRGSFRRRGSAGDVYADPCTAYFEQPGEEHEFAHPAPGGDVCTAIEVSAALVAAAFAGDPELAASPIFTDHRLDLEHRLLVAAARAHRDRHELEERLVTVLAAVGARASPNRVESGRPTTVARRRRLVDEARQLLMLEPGLGLVELAARVGTSPHHLSRTFARETGEGVARYRNRLRTGRALERLAAGEENLARLAADLGFADQSHLCAVVRRAYGSPPSMLRRLLSAAA